PLFTTNPQAISASLTVMLFSFLGGPATAGTLIYTALWQALGKAKLPFYATTLGMWGLRIVLGYVLGVVLNQGLMGVWLATIVDNIFRWLFLKYLYHRSLLVHE
ncbi:MAG: MATE family efflux transporter, partial [Enterococcus sp.]|nr:MATE family efflux transporter [Enterococcus sp.]